MSLLLVSPFCRMTLGTCKYRFEGEQRHEKTKWKLPEFIADLRRYGERLVVNVRDRHSESFPVPARLTRVETLRECNRART